jgi:DNA-binding PadR family transcriptional regulator
MTPTRAEFHVLLALLGGARHGYGLMQDVEELSAGTLKIGPGTLYTAIKRLHTAGLIAECDADGDRRRCYRLTKHGKASATAEAQRMSDLLRVARKRGLLPSPS